MGKNELAPIANCNVTGLATNELLPFNPLRSRSHGDASVFHDHLLKRAGRVRLEIVAAAIAGCEMRVALNAPLRRGYTNCENRK